MHTIALVSQKGGAGKTTLAIHLAAEAASFGKRVLLLDLDPQASAAGWGDRRGEKPPDVSTEHPGRVEAALQAAEREGYALAVLDTAPHADQAALKAARVADQVLIPCRPAVFDLDAIQATLDLCALAAKPALVVLNAAPIRSRVTEESAKLIHQRGGQIAGVVVHERVAFRHCLIAGQVADEFEPAGRAAEEIRALWQLVNLTSSQSDKSAHSQSHKPTRRKERI